VKDNLEGTLFGNIIRNRYIRDFDWAENAAGAEELSRYRAASSLFRKYGTDCGMDSTLLAEQVGRETVQHVGNIFKYYLTYRWINTADAERAAARRASGIGS
jgi:hypothetical protein